jgi:hypothetical protein
VPRNLILRKLRKMELTNLTIMGFYVLNFVLILAIVFILFKIRQILKNKFMYLVLSIISVIVLIIALTYGLVSALNFDKISSEFIITQGFY